MDSSALEWCAVSVPGLDKPSTQSNQAKIVTTKESVQIVSHEENDRWYTSIIRSGFDDDGLSTFMNTMIVDTVVVAERIDIKDFL